MRKIVKNVFPAFISFFRSPKRIPPILTEQTRLRDLFTSYPTFREFLQKHYGTTVQTRELAQKFGRFCRKQNLPPASVLYMQFQIRQRTEATEISPRELKQALENNPGWILLDVREAWEREWGVLPGSRPLNTEVLKEALAGWDRNTPIAVYCHYGVRSLDAAAYLADQGFVNTRALSGGMEAWATQVDPQFPKYPGQPC